MKYYRIIEHNPQGWDIANIIINTMGGIHYSTGISKEGTYRNFVVEFDEIGLLHAKLKLFNADIKPLSDMDEDILRGHGHIDSKKVSSSDTLRRLERF